MPCVVTIEWKGVTAEEYDLVCESGLHDDPGPGAIAHVAAVDAEGLHIVDVWESPEQFQQFVETKLMPAVAGAGLGDREQPTVEVRPIHKAVRFDSADVA